MNRSFFVLENPIKFSIRAVRSTQTFDTILKGSLMSWRKTVHGIEFSYLQLAIEIDTENVISGFIWFKNCLLHTFGKIAADCAHLATAWIRRDIYMILRMSTINFTKYPLVFQTQYIVTKMRKLSCTEGQPAQFGSWRHKKQLYVRRFFVSRNFSF